MPQTTLPPLSEYSHHGRDMRLAEGRAVVALAMLSFLAMIAIVFAVILEVWR